MVFVLDDDPVYSRVILFYLKSKGIELEIYNYSDDLLTALDEEEPDVLLLDFHVDKYSAPQLMDKIRERTQAPAYFVSSEDAAYMATALEQHEVKGYFEKNRADSLGKIADALKDQMDQ